jgi:hypothetical protein
MKGDDNMDIFGRGWISLGMGRMLLRWGLPWGWFITPADHVNKSVSWALVHVNQISFSLTSKHSVLKATWLLNNKSRLNLSHKLLINNAVLKPTRTCGLPFNRRSYPKWRMPRITYPTLPSLTLKSDGEGSRWNIYIKEWKLRKHDVILHFERTHFFEFFQIVIFLWNVYLVSLIIIP